MPLCPSFNFKFPKNLIIKSNSEAEVYVELKTIFKNAFFTEYTSLLLSILFLLFYFSVKFCSILKFSEIVIQKDGPASVKKPQSELVSTGL